MAELAINKWYTHGPCTTRLNASCVRTPYLRGDVQLSYVYTAYCVKFSYRQAINLAILVCPLVTDESCLKR